MKSVNQPEQVLRGVFHKEDFTAVNMIKPSILSAAHSFASFINTEPFSNTQLPHFCSDSQTPSSSKQIHSFLHNSALNKSSSQITQSDTPSAPHKVTEPSLKDMLSSDEQGDLMALRVADQSRPSSPTNDSPCRFPDWGGSSSRVVVRRV